MANVRVNEAGYHLARWYRHAWGGQAHPTREVLYQELAVRAELFRFRPLARLKVPILVQLAAVNGDVPTEAEVDLAVRGLKGGRSGCSSEMRAEDVKGWRKEDKREKDPEGIKWEMMVRLV